MKGRHIFHCNECDTDNLAPCKKQECREARKLKRRNIGLLPGAPMPVNFTWAKPYIEWTPSRQAFHISLFDEPEHDRYLTWEQFADMIMSSFQGEEKTEREMITLGTRFMELGHQIKQMGLRKDHIPVIPK